MYMRIIVCTYISYMCAHVRKYTCMCVYVCACIHTYMYTWICACMYICVYAYMYLCTYAHSQKCNMFVVGVQPCSGKFEEVKCPNTHSTMFQV